MEIVLDAVSKSYGEKQVLERFSCRIPQGSAAALMAPSGAGKTTLLRLLLGLERADTGVIRGVPRERSVLFQEDRLCPGLSVLANIRMVTGRRVPEEEILQLLAMLGLKAEAHSPAHTLSGGQARRAALARALLHPGELLVLDEPFAGLDEATRHQTAETITRYRRGRTLIVVTHADEDRALLGTEQLIQIP